MAKDVWAYLRTMGLVVMIVCAVLATAILYWQGQIIWAVFWSCIIALVGGFEIFAYATKKKTISTIWKEWTQKSPELSYTTLLLLATSLLGLWIHLAVWGGMFNK
jgi:uncharacterized protein YacL